MAKVRCWSYCPNCWRNEDPSSIQKGCWYGTPCWRCKGKYRRLGGKVVEAAYLLGRWDALIEIIRQREGIDGPTRILTLAYCQENE